MPLPRHASYWAKGLHKNGCHGNSSELYSLDKSLMLPCLELKHTPYKAVTMTHYRQRSHKSSGKQWGHGLSSFDLIPALDNTKSKNKSPMKQYSGTGTSQPYAQNLSSGVYACTSPSQNVPKIVYYQWQLPSAEFKAIHHISNLLSCTGVSHKMPLHGHSSSKPTWSFGVPIMRTPMRSSNQTNTDFLTFSLIHKQKHIFYPWIQLYSEHGRELS